MTSAGFGSFGLRVLALGRSNALQLTKFPPPSSFSIKPTLHSNRLSKIRALSSAATSGGIGQRPPQGGAGRPSFSTPPPGSRPPPAQNQPATGSHNPSKVIFNVGATDFKQIVLDSPVPVILDCWAEWCGPCRQLGPVLEAAVKAHNGKVRMAKLDTDKHPQLAQQLGIKSLPTVMMVNEGKLVDQFVGFSGEQQVKEFVQKAAGFSRGAAHGPNDPNDLMGMQAMVANVIELLKVTATPAAPGEKKHDLTKEEMQDMIEALRTIAGHKLEPLPPGTTKTPKRRSDEEAMELIRGIAHAGLIRCALVDKNIEAAKEIAQVTKSTFPKSVQEHPEVKSALSLAALATGGAGGASDAADEVRNQLMAKLNAKPNDSASRLALAKALFADGAHGQAIDQALELLKRDRGFQDGAARALLIDIFNALGNTDVVKEARRRMTSIMLH